MHNDTYKVVKLYEDKHTTYAEISAYDTKEEALRYCKVRSLAEQAENYADNKFSLEIEKKNHVVTFVVKKYNEYHCKITYIMALS